MIPFSLALKSAIAKVGRSRAMGAVWDEVRAGRVARPPRRGRRNSVVERRPSGLTASERLADRFARRETPASRARRIRRKRVAPDRADVIRRAIGGNRPRLPRRRRKTVASLARFRLKRLARRSPAAGVAANPRRFRVEHIAAPSYFTPGSFRTIVRGQHRVTIGRLKGKRTTAAVRVLHPIGENACPFGRPNPGRRRPATHDSGPVWVAPPTRLRRKGKCGLLYAYGSVTRYCDRAKGHAGPCSGNLGQNPQRAGLQEIYSRVREVVATKGRRSIWPGQLFKHKFTRGGKILGVAKSGRYHLPKGALVIRGRKPLWKSFDYDRERIR